MVGEHGLSARVNLDADTSVGAFPFVEFVLVAVNFLLATTMAIQFVLWRVIYLHLPVLYMLIWFALRAARAEACVNAIMEERVKILEKCILLMINQRSEVGGGSVGARMEIGIVDRRWLQKMIGKEYQFIYGFSLY